MEISNNHVNCISDDDSSDSSPQYIPGHFEGPEKTMEVVFRPGIGPEDGLRLLSREQLDVLCTKAKCSIVSCVGNGHMDAYVLSESSLFVYRRRFIMKTCGTTTLLRCLSTLLAYADNLGLELDWVGYSRKNLMFPNAQLWPHSNFGDEINYLNTHAKLQDRLRGSGHILGPITGDHWFVYVADHSAQLCAEPSMSISAERTLNMMMFDMSPEVAECFFEKNCGSAKEMTSRSGIFKLVPGATIDEVSFSPCGYSMNAVLHDAYSTIHVTPEESCSYASFETNTCLRDYTALVRNVLGVFRPKRFVLTLFGDDAALRTMAELPTDPKFIALPGFGTFVRTSLSFTKVENELSCLMGCFSLEFASLPPPVAASVPIGTTTTALLHSAARPARDRGYSDMI